MLEQSGPVIPANVDRRRSARHERRVSAWLSDASGGGIASSQQQVSVSNLSLHGIGFTAPHRVELEDFHWIVIASDRLSLSTRIRVMNVRENAEGAFDVGAEFY
jgi:PilZ domain